MVDRLEQSGELLSNFSLGLSGIEVSTQTLSEADQWQVTESATQRPGHGGRHDSGKCQPHRHPGKRLEEPKGEPAAEGAGAVHPELGTWQEAPAMLHKWQLLWLTSRAHGLSHLAQGTGTGQSTLHSGFGLEQRAVTPPPGEGRLKASHGVTLASTCWASHGGCGGPLWLGGRGLCPHHGLAQQGPRFGGGEEPERALGDPLGPCEGPRACIAESPPAARAVLHCGHLGSCVAPSAGALGSYLGTWGEGEAAAVPPRAGGWGSP